MPLRAIIIDDDDNMQPRGVLFETVAMAELVITTSGKVIKDRYDRNFPKRRVRRAARLLGIQEK